jgi:hypothetical protein
LSDARDDSGPTTTATATVSARTPGGVVHLTSRSLTRFGSRHAAPLIHTPSLPAAPSLPMLRPTMRIAWPPYTGPDDGSTRLTTGPSYSKGYRASSPDGTPSTATTTGAGPGSPGGTVHLSSLRLTYSSFWHGFPPTVAVRFTLLSSGP